MIRLPAGDLRLAAIAIAAAIAVPARAHAQPSAAGREAAEAFDRGLEHKAAGDWDAACPAFEASERAEASAGAELNLVTCRQRAGHLLEAAALAHQARERAVAKGEQPKIDLADQRLAELAQRTPSIAIHVPDGRRAAATIDGVAIEASALAAPIAVDPGSHRIAIAWDGGAPLEVELAIAEGERVPLEAPPRVDLPVRRTPGPPAAPIAAATPAAPRHRSSTIAIVIGIGGLALAGAGAYTLHAAYDAQRLADDACPDADRCPSRAAADDARTFNDRAVRRSQIAVGLFAGAGVALGVATYLWLRAPSDAPRAEVAISGDGVAIHYAGRF